VKIERKILDAWNHLPDSVKERKASESELLKFENENSVIPIEYRWFLLNLGGGPVGSEIVDGIDSLADSHSKFRRETECEDGWRIKGFIIGWDGAGNPIVIDERGRVLFEDHNFGGIHELFPSFKAMLETELCSAT
jgi:hypothetical protein